MIKQKKRKELQYLSIFYNYVGLVVKSLDSGVRQFDFKYWSQVPPLTGFVTVKVTQLFE